MLIMPMPIGGGGRGRHCFHPVRSSFIKSLYVQLPLYFKREFLKTLLIFLVLFVVSVLFVLCTVSELSILDCTYGIFVSLLISMCRSCILIGPFLKELFSYYDLEYFIKMPGTYVCPSKNT